MRKLLLFLLALPLFATPPVVSNVSFLYVGYSTATVVFNTSASYDHIQILYALSPNTCTAGGTTGGGTTGYYLNNQGNANGGGSGYNTYAIGGLTPGASYQVCPEVSNDGGTTWSSGAGATLQLKAKPDPLPSPVLPAQFDTTYPDLTKGSCWSNSQSGYCTMVVDTPCRIGGNGSESGPAGTVDNDIALSIKHQMASGTVILIPSGQVCDDSNMTWYAPAPDGVGFDTTAVANYTITMSNALSTYTQAGPDGITEGAGVKLTRLVYTSDIYTDVIPTVANAAGSQKTLPPDLYFVHVTGANTFQLYWPYTRISSVQTTSGSNTVSVTSLLGQGGATPGVEINAEAVSTTFPADTTVTAISGANGQYTITLSNAATATATVPISFGGGDVSNITPIPNMPLQIQAGTTTHLHDSLLYFYPRNLYWVDVRSCVEGKNCIASWDSTTAYVIGDETTVGGEVYQATAANTNQVPPGASWADVGSLVSILDSTLPPQGTRIDTSWLPNMAALEASEYATGGFLFFQDDSVGHLGFATSHIRFDGLQIQDAPGTELSSNPVNYEEFIDTYPQMSDIVFDRIVSGVGYTNANRDHLWMDPGGHNFAITNSYLVAPISWAANYSGPGLDAPAEVGPTPVEATTTSFTVQQLTVGYGASQPASLPSTLTVSWTGTPDSSITTPEIMVYFDMQGNLKVIAPQGLTVSTSPESAAIAYTTTSGSMTCNERDPLAPVDAHGRGELAPLGCASIATDGTISVLKAGAIPKDGRPDYSVESCGCIYSMSGPGPFLFRNNYYEYNGIGIIWSLESFSALRNDFTVERNTFHWPVQFLTSGHNSFARTAGINSANGMWLGGHAQPLEEKEGSRILVKGNIFTGGVHADQSDGYAFDITPSAGGLGVLTPTIPGASNVTMTDNTIEHFPNGIGCAYIYSDQNMRGPQQGCMIANNLLWDINGLVYSNIDDIGFGVSGWAGKGNAFIANSDTESVIIDHNTVLPIFGTEGQFIFGDGPQQNEAIQGVQITNNILPWSISASGQNFLFYNCGSTNPATVLGSSCYNAEFSGNVIIPGFSSGSTYPPSGSQFSASAISTALGSFAAGNSILTADTDVLTTLKNVGWRDMKNFLSVPVNEWDSDGQYVGPVPDLRLKSSSAYNAVGRDGLQAGVNMNTLRAAQGAVTLVGANQITSTSANITYIAPDSAACRVDYGNSDPTLINSFTRVSDGGGARVRNVSLTGLSAGTSYSYRVDCAVEQPTGSFVTK